MKSPKKTSSGNNKNTVRKQQPSVVKAKTPASAKKEKAVVKGYDDAVTDAFIKEVDEEVHNDELKVFWNKYGLFVILFVVLAVCAAVSFETIKNWRDRQYQAQTENYLASVQSAENAENTIRALEKIAAGDNGLYSELARIQIATVLMDQGKTTEAEDMLRAIVENEELSPRVTHLAAIKLATYKIDSASAEELDALLQPVAQSGGSWSPLAQELLAMTAIREGQIEKARELYNNLLQNPEISANFKNRIQDMLSSLNDM